MNDSNSAYWREQLSLHWPYLDKIARRRFAESHTADEVLLYVTEQLQADNWRRLRAYQGKSTLKTYITRIAIRLFEDFARRRYGRLRPPDWLTAQGPLWVEVFKLLCHERMARSDALAHLIDAAPGRRSPDVVEEAMDAIHARLPNCGQARAGEVPTDPDDIDNTKPTGSSPRRENPETIYATLERVSILESLAQLFGADQDTAFREPAAAGALEGRLKDAIDHLGLKTEERLLLKMVYQDGLSVSDAGRLLEWTPDQTHGRLRRLMARIRQTFETAGLTEILREMMEG